MTFKQDLATTTGSQRGSILLAIGGLIGAVAASSCCILPLVLFGLGVSGAWIGNFTQLAPYQPLFIAVTIACLGCGYWLVYRSPGVACANDAVCSKPWPKWMVKAGLIVATMLVALALGIDLVAPLLFNS